MEAFISEAEEVIDSPDLAETTCLDISMAASDLHIQLMDARNAARDDPAYTWKDRNDLNVAYERIGEFSMKATDTFLKLSPESVHVDEVKAKREEVEQKKRTA